MKIIPAKTPELVKHLFPNFVWDIHPKEKVLYLTFDDGPTPEVTDWVLNTLKAYNAKATFFCIGKNIAAHSLIFKNILKAGHGIGNHTYNHIKGWQSNTNKYLKDTAQTDALIFTQMSFLRHRNKPYSEEFRLFRPPYGKFKIKQSKALQNFGYKIVLWDVLSYDWDPSIPREDCLKNVTKNAQQGSIVVFHDSVKAMKNLSYVLPKVLDFYTTKGYTFKALTKHTFV